MQQTIKYVCLKRKELIKKKFRNRINNCNSTLILCLKNTPNLSENKIIIYKTMMYYELVNRNLTLSNSHFKID